MAKLQNVTTIDMVNGEITAIKYDGAVYSKVDGRGKLGDVLLRVKRGIPGQVSLGGYYEGHDNRYDDDLAIYYRDEEGDVVSASQDRFVVFRKAETSAPFAEMVVSRVEAVEQRMDAVEAKLAPEEETLKVGDYAVITGKGDRGFFSSHRFKIGEVVRIIRGGSYGDRKRAENLSGRTEWSVYNGYMRKATEAEVAAATAPAKPTTGDIVVITANTNGSRNKVGDIGKVFLAKSTGARVNVLGNEAQSGNYTYYDEMRLATPAEIEKYEASLVQVAKDSVFIKAGRKPNEYRKGDLVRVVDSPCASANGTIIEVKSILFSGTFGGNDGYGYQPINVEIVCFAGNRADLAKGAC